MRALLDTHAFLWWIGNDPRLSTRAREIIADDGNEIVLSAVSAWEIAIKASLGRFAIRGDIASFVKSNVTASGFEVLPLLIEHALRVASLPDHHRDPFDRALVAQAQVEDLALLTTDRAISRYSVRILW
jgi:PIN domain nuclease of toxin-antitoxin system